MKRGFSCGVFVLVILALCIGPDITWAEDTSSRIYNLESRVDDLENQTSSIGVHWIGSAECDGYDFFVRNTLGPSPNVTRFPASAYCPIRIPFKCTITEVQFKAKDNSYTSDMVFEVHDGYFDAGLDEHVPIDFVDTTGWTSTTTYGTYGTFTTGPINLPYDPTNFDYDQPWWIRIKFNAAVPYQRLRWSRIYYTVP